MKIRKLIGKIHLWLGLVSGLVVFIVSATGCIWVFQEEIRPLVYKQRMFVDTVPDSDRLSLTKLLEHAKGSLGNAYEPSRMNYPNDRDRTVEVVFRKYDHGHWEYYYTVYLNPYTGEIAKVENTNREFFRVVLELHMNLMLGGGIGRQIVGYSVLIFVILLITGIVLWWPRNRNAFRVGTWFRWKPTTRWRRKNYDLHNVPGFYSFVIALMLAVTGLVFSFQWLDRGIQWVANGGKTIEHPMIEHRINSFEKVGGLDQIMAQVMDNHKEAKSFGLYFPREKGGILYLRTTLSDDYNDQINYQFDSHTGQLLQSTAWDELNNGEKVRGLNFPIHVGSIFGLPTKLLAFFASLISASLPITGFLIWYGRKFKKRKR